MSFSICERRYSNVLFETGGEIKAVGKAAVVSNSFNAEELVVG